MVRNLAAVAIAAVLSGWSFLAWFSLGMAQANSPLAASMPFNQASTAQRQLLIGNLELTKAQREQLALVAVRRAPLSAQPLAYLALVAEEAGDERKTERLIESAKGLGWHDEAVQRILYNWAASGSDHAATLRHAEAMLRQGLAEEDLTSDFVRKSGDANFRAAMVAMLSQKGMWANRWAALEAPRLDNRSLGDLFASQQFRRNRSSESLTILASQLVHSGRTRLAWQLAHGPQASGPIHLDWLPETDFPASAVFSWQLPGSHTVAEAGEGKLQLKRQDAVPGDPARLRLGLAPGRYRITFAQGGQTGFPGWKAGFACGTDRPGSLSPVVAAIDISVDPACEQQTLFVNSDVGTASMLPPPILHRLGN
jgi:hypothetical protein